MMLCMSGTIISGLDAVETVLLCDGFTMILFWLASSCLDYLWCCVMSSLWCCGWVAPSCLDYLWCCVMSSLWCCGWVAPSCLDESWGRRWGWKCRWRRLRWFPLPKTFIGSQIWRGVNISKYLFVFFPFILVTDLLPCLFCLLLDITQDFTDKKKIFFWPSQ